jgi:hypothetical protein
MKKSRNGISRDALDKGQEFLLEERKSYELQRSIKG